MSNKKIKQHYVWRHYLRAWAEDEKIWTYFKEFNKVERPNLMGVGQEKYFYKLVDFTPKEEEFLSKLIDKMSPPVIKGINQDFLKMFTFHYKLRQKLIQGNIENKADIENQLSILETNMMEDAHCKFEEMGFKITSCRELEDLKFLENENDFFETNIFLCIQYFRTKNIKNNVLKSFEDEKAEIATKYWNILSFVMAMVLARSLSLDKTIKYLLFENQTNVSFITGDQPVFNILNDNVNEKGEVVDLELYYPLSPNRALLVHFKEHQQNKIDRAPINETMVAWFNKKVVENSSFYIFSENSEMINDLIS